MFFDCGRFVLNCCVIVKGGCLYVFCVLDRVNIEYMGLSMCIFIINDDGIQVEGLLVMEDIVKEFVGFDGEVWIVVFVFE